MVTETQLDISTYFRPNVRVTDERIGNVDGLVSFIDSAAEVTGGSLLLTGPVWVRHDGESYVALETDYQPVLTCASRYHPETKVAIAIFESADAEKAETFLRLVGQARLGGSPEAMDDLIRALYSNDAQGRTLRTLLFGTAAKALGVEEICRRVLFNPQKVSLFNQRKKALGLTRKRREPEHEKIQQTSESKLTQEDCPAEEPSVPTETESTCSSVEELDMLADCWLGRHISLGDIPPPALDILELRSLLEKTDVGEDKLLEGLKDTWQARYDASDKTNPGQLFAELRAELVSRLREHAGAKQNDPHPN